ncbi:MAG: DUF1674 domain-containing protein [Pseudomonadota bacterium]
MKQGDGKLTGPDVSDDNDSIDSGAQPAAEQPESTQPREIGGRDGPDPTRFGDWEKNGRCIDF